MNEIELIQRMIYEIRGQRVSSQFVMTQITFYK